MNTSIARLFVLIVVLFGLLVAWTSRWSVFEAEALRDNALNRRPVLAELQIRRGAIRARGGLVLARSVPVPGARTETFTRRYPNGELFAHAVGYSYIATGQAGLERYYNDALLGRRDEVSTLLRQLSGERDHGDTLVTNLDPAGQRAALSALAGRAGSVVALEPATGKVRVMASNPGFDPGVLRDAEEFASLQGAEGSPLFNRSTQGRYPPGSTFKVVTAAAALDSGRYEPSSVVSGRSPKTISGVPLQNAGGQDFGPVTLTQALTQSVNTVWAEVGVELGRDVISRYMRRFGFTEQPPLDYPDGQIAPSGAYVGNRAVSARSRFVDLGRLAIGQDRLQVTPLQMAMVAAAVANDGVLMEPRLADRVVDRDGRTVEEIEPERMSRVMSRSAARQLQEMMANVVREGTGTAAALQGIDVAGKTGTAEINPQANVNQPWFIAFAPTNDPKIAIAATVERSSGQGGTVAAPVAKQVLEALLR